MPACPHALTHARTHTRRDLGAYGMGIPIGKRVVFGGCGVDPATVLPITIDVGCNNAELVDDVFYTGTRCAACAQHRA